MSPRRGPPHAGTGRPGSGSGLRLVLAGGALCLAAGGLLLWSLVQDLGAAREAPYDAVGQQLTALLLVTGTPLLGRGLSARRAASESATTPRAGTGCSRTPGPSAPGR
ncbi:hypothetical protein [Streptomyces sp. NPDC046685]|uniref:hypothetical protein n=1 Tax=Streptomyces sp. NPDC046685 TaxID=3157202 RepID=UPI0033C6A1AD